MALEWETPKGKYSIKKPEDQAPMGSGEEWKGQDRRRADLQLVKLEERLMNLINEKHQDHQRFETDIRKLDLDLESMRAQTHDWMQKLMNRQPPWVISVMTTGGTVIGAMAMWILTHSR